MAHSAPAPAYLHLSLYQTSALQRPGSLGGEVAGKPQRLSALQNMSLHHMDAIYPYN